MAPASAVACSRAARLTPSPRRSSPTTTTSARCKPKRRSRTLAPGTAATDVAPGVADVLLGQLHYLAQALALIVIAFLAIWFVARPILTARPAGKDAEQPQLAAETTRAGLEGPDAPDALRLITGQATGGGGQLMVAPADDTPHGRAVTALTDAVDRHPEAALRTLRHWLKDGASEEAA